MVIPAPHQQLCGDGLPAVLVPRPHGGLSPTLPPALRDDGLGRRHGGQQAQYAALAPRRRPSLPLPEQEVPRAQVSRISVIIIIELHCACHRNIYYCE